MAFRVLRIGAMRVADPARWEGEVRRAMALVGGRIPDAARHLGVAPRTLYKWLQEPALADVPRVAHGETRPGNRRGRKPKASGLRVDRVD